jgi:signal peptidase II
MTKLQRAVLLGIVCPAVIASDQATKLIAMDRLQLGALHSYLGDTFRLQLAHNYGAFLSLGASLSEGLRHAVWSVGVGCVLAILALYALLAKEMNRPTLLALALILAGGLSNLYDRLAYGGYVIDFLNVGIGGLRTGIFNIADMGIMAGAILILVGAVRGAPQKQPGV